MKKIFFIAMVAFGLAANAQGQFNAGLNVGLPLGDADKLSSFTLMPEVNYLFEVSDEFKVGPSVAYNLLFGKDITTTIGNVTSTTEGKNSSFLPVAVAGRFNPSEDFILGADLGYGVGLNEGNDGGFYYRPVVAYNVADNIALQLSYSGVMVGGKESTTTVGGSTLTVKGKDITYSSLSLGAVFSLE